VVGIEVDAWAVLAAARAGAELTVAALSRELRSVVEAAAGGATDDEHDPDGSTTAFERAQVAALLARARGHLIAVEQAEQRLRAGSYGRCQRCGAAIATERLTALPATAYCVTCAAQRSR